MDQKANEIENVYVIKVNCLKTIISIISVLI